VLAWRPFCWLVTRSHIAQMKRQFRKRGNKIIFFGRFLAGFRSVMCMTAGLSHVPPWKFVLIDLCGAAIVVTVVTSLGWWFSHNIKPIIEGMAAVEHVLGGLAAAAMAAWVIYIHLSKRRSKVVARMIGEENNGVQMSDDSQDNDVDRPEDSNAVEQSKTKTGESDER